MIIETVPVAKEPWEMGVDIQISATVSGVPVEYIKMGKAKGERLFAKHGFAQQPNKSYWRKDNVYVHYNAVDKTWHIERTAPIAQTL